MKRTPKNGGEKRDAVFRFRATADEITRIKQQAKTDRVSVSEYIRRKLQRTENNTDRTDFIRLLAEIGKQGSNLNQYTKALNVWVNTGKEPPFDPATIKQCLIEITRLSKELMEIIKHGYRRKNQG